MDYRDERDRDNSRSPMRSPIRSNSRSPVRSENPGTNLFVTGLIPKVKESEIEEVFGKYGIVEKIQLMRDPHSDDSRGFGFINFSTADEADAALALNGLEFMGKTLIVQKAKRGKARTPTPGQYRGPVKDRRDELRGPPRDYQLNDRYDRPRYDDRRNDRYDEYRDRRSPVRYDDRRRDFDRFEPRGYDRDDRGPPRQDPRDRRDDFDDRRPPPPRRDFDDRRPPPRDYDRRPPYEAPRERPRY